MKSGNNILETFSNEKCEVLLKLIEWTFEELNELKERYKIDYNATQSRYIKGRIDLLEEAITIKKGNEEQAWDYLT